MRAISTSSRSNDDYCHKQASKCCDCNGPSAVCKNCKCVKNKTKCLNCLPMKRKKCANQNLSIISTQHSHDVIHSKFNINSDTDISTKMKKSIDICPPLINQDVNDGTTSSVHSVIQPNNFAQHEDNSVRGDNQFNTDLLNYLGHVPVFTRIPRSVRTTFCNKFTSLLEAVCAQPEASKTWVELFTFSPYVLHRDGNKPKANDDEKSIAAKVKQRLSNFNQDTILSFLKGLSEKNMLKSRGSTGPTKKDTHKLIGLQLDDGNISGAARVVTSDETIAQYSDENMEQLMEKHPYEAPPIMSPPSDIPHIYACPESVYDCLSSFPPGSSHGLDGLKPQHIKDCFNCMSDNKENIKKGVFSAFLRTLTKFVNICLKGQVHHAIRPYFFGARLLAFKKKDGGLRPIAVGGTLRRLTAKVCMAKVAESAGKLLRPYQLGVGTKGGCEAAIHCGRHFVQSMPDTDAVLKIDLKNAFNCIKRDHFLHVVAEKFPQLWPFIQSCYGYHSNLVFNDKVIISASGVQQGDPLGPLIFSVGIHHVVEQINANLNMWYLDDCCIGGDVVSICNNFAIIIEQTKKIGLSINVTKCEFTCASKQQCSSFLAQFPGCKVTEIEDFELLGSPAGSAKAIEHKLDEFVQNLAQWCEKLSTGSLHNANFLLYKCLFTPKLIFLLRSACVFKVNMQEFSSKCQTILSQLYNIDFLDEKIWAQSSLPVKEGGLGLRDISKYAATCFLASMHSTVNLQREVLKTPVDLEEKDEYLQALSQWKSVAGQEECPTAKQCSYQKEWDLPICKRVHSGLTDGATPYDKVRIRSVRSDKASAWLNAIPSSNLGLRLSNQQFHAACCLRLGANMITEHPCTHCGRQVDPKGSHLLSCKQSWSKKIRHDCLNRLVQGQMKSHGIAVMLEPKNLLPTCEKVPDGISLVPIKEGKCVAWDITVVHPTSESYLHQTEMLHMAEQKKIHKYSDLSTDFMFYPLGLETFGAISTHFLQFVRLVKRGRCEGLDATFFFQNLSLNLQRENANIILAYCSQLT